MLKEKTRDYSLDVLKIVATLIIVFHHYQQTYNVRFTNLNFFGGSFYFGWVVELFFVISGVLMYRYISLIEDDGLTFPQFMKKRYFRLMPLVAMGAIVYEILICIYPLLYSQLWAGERKLNLWGTFLTSLGIQAGWASENPCINNPTWYVSVLILCYVIFYFISYISRGGGK